MSQTVAYPTPHVFDLRRKKVPDELSLPADYVQPDYTALEEEPEPNKPRGPMVFIIVLFLVFGLLGVGVFLLNGEEEPPPPEPATIEINRANLISTNNMLVTRITARTANVQDGTLVQATLLENGQPFTFWEEQGPTAEVTAGTVEFEIPASEDLRQNGTEAADYTVKLVVQDQAAAESQAPLEIPTAVSDEFYSGAAEAEPTERPTSTPRPEPSPTPEGSSEEPTLEPQPEGPLANISISRPGIAYQSPYGPSISVGEVAPGQLTTLVAKLPVGTETWYLVPVPVSNVSGWINSNLIDLPPADVNRIPTVSGDYPFAVVFNGGNVRNAPSAGDTVGAIDAGINVRLQGRLSDNSWYQIETPDGTVGWVSNILLTVNPEILGNVPVTQ